MLAVPVLARALAVAVDIGTEVPGDLEVLRQAAVDERRRLVVLRRDDVGVPLRQPVQQLGKRGTGERDSPEERQWVKVDAYLAKPVRGDLLMAKVRQFLG